MVSLTSCYFGKLPIQGDFIRHAAGVPELGRMDQWFQEGIHRTQLARGSDWNADYDALESQDFVYWCAETGAALAGVCSFSRDRVGRRYPFVLAVRIEGPLPALAFDTLPVGLADFQLHAAGLVETGWRDGEPDAFFDRLRSLCWQNDADAAATLFDAFLDSHRAETIWRAVLGDAPAERRATLLFDLWSTLRQQPFPPRFVVRLPTSGSAGEIAFWLTLVRRWSPPGAVPVLCRWLAKQDSRPGSISFVFDELASRYFEPVFWPERDSDHAWDPAAPSGTTEERVRSAEARFGAVVGAGSGLRELLDALTAIGQKDQP